MIDIYDIPCNNNGYYFSAQQRACYLQEVCKCDSWQIAEIREISVTTVWQYTNSRQVEEFYNSSIYEICPWMQKIKDYIFEYEYEIANKKRIIEDKRRKKEAREEYYNNNMDYQKCKDVFSKTCKKLNVNLHEPCAYILMMIDKENHAKCVKVGSAANGIYSRFDTLITEQREKAIKNNKEYYYPILLDTIPVYTKYEAEIMESLLHDYFIRKNISLCEGWSTKRKSVAKDYFNITQINLQDIYTDEKISNIYNIILDTHNEE